MKSYNLKTKQQPYSTQVGEIYGKDAIFLNNVIYRNSTLVLQGSFDGDACSKGKKGSWMNFEMTFSDVMYFDVKELDLIDLDDDTYPISNFDEISNSNLITDFKKIEDKKMTDNFKHFAISTYDDVFTVVCKDLKIELGRIKPKDNEIDLNTKIKQSIDGEPENDWMTIPNNSLDKETMNTIRKDLEEDKYGLIMVHRFYWGASASHREFFNEFTDFEKYIDKNARPGDNIILYTVENTLKEYNILFDKYIPDKEGRTPIGGAY